MEKNAAHVQNPSAKLPLLRPLSVYHFLSPAPSSVASARLEAVSQSFTSPANTSGRSSALAEASIVPSGE